MEVPAYNCDEHTKGRMTELARIGTGRKVRNISALQLQPVLRHPDIRKSFEFELT